MLGEMMNQKPLKPPQTLSFVAHLSNSVNFTLWKECLDHVEMILCQAQFFLLPRGWRKGSQSYPLGCLNRSTRTMCLWLFHLVKIRMATWWVRWAGDFYPTKKFEKSRDEDKNVPHKQGWTQATFFHQIAFFYVDSSNNVNKHWCGLFFSMWKVWNPHWIHSFWHFHEKFDHLGTDSPGDKHPVSAFKTIITN